MKKQIFALLLASVVSSSALARLEMDSSQLMMKNGDQMTDLIKKRMKKAADIQEKVEESEDDDATLHVEPEALQTLKGAMRLVLSRPDQDGSRANLFAPLRRELNDMNATEQVLEELADEAIDALKDSSSPVNVQTTYVVLLENLMAEIKSEMNAVETFKGIIAKIRDANIKISEKVKSKQMMKSMSKPVSPSETAKKILPADKKKK